MPLPISLASPPSRSSAPSSYVTNMDSWLGNNLQGLVDDINALEASDWFSVQSSSTDTTAGTIALQGNDADYNLLTADQLKLGSNNSASETDISLNGNAVINAETSISFGWESGGFARFMAGVTDVDGGTAGGTVVWRIDSGAMTLNGVEIWAEEITVADDAVGTVDMPGSRKGGLVSINTIGTSEDQVQNADSAVLRLDAGTSNAVSQIDVGADVDTSTATLTGTTGTDGKTTIAPNTSGQIQIENRSGNTQTYRAVVL